MAHFSPLSLIYRGKLVTLDIDEAAEFLKINRQTALQLSQSGILPGAKIGRAWVFLEEDLKDYLRSEVKKQQRLRQIEADVDGQLASSVSFAKTHTSNVITPIRKPGRKARTLPNLDDYTSTSPQLVGQAAGA